jgi:hypothetical protein
MVLFLHPPYMVLFLHPPYMVLFLHPPYMVLFLHPPYYRYSSTAHPLSCSIFNEFYLLAHTETLSHLNTAYAKLHGCYKALIGGYSHYGTDCAVLCGHFYRCCRCVFHILTVSHPPLPAAIIFFFLALPSQMLLPLMLLPHPPPPSPPPRSRGSNRILPPHDSAQAGIPRLLRHTRQSCGGDRNGVLCCVALLDCCLLCSSLRYSYISVPHHCAYQRSES